MKFSFSKIFSCTVDICTLCKKTELIEAKPCHGFVEMDLGSFMLVCQAVDPTSPLVHSIYMQLLSEEKRDKMAVIIVVERDKCE